MSQSVQNVNPRWDNPAAHNGKYPPDWEARRDVVFKRDNYTCQSCGHMSGPHAGSEGRALHPHHIIPLSKGGSHSFSNLQTLCGACHNAHHDHDIFADDTSGFSFKEFIGSVVRAGAFMLFFLLLIAGYSAVVLGAGLLMTSSTPLPPLEIGAGAIATVLGVGAALFWPRLAAVVFAVIGSVVIGLATMIPGVHLADPPVLLMVCLFGVPVLAAARTHFSG